MAKKIAKVKISDCELNRRENILESETVGFVRDMYSHLLSLTRITVTLNVATIIALSVIGRLTNDENSQTLVARHPVFVIFFGVLVALFGTIFNYGAYAGYKGLVEIIQTLYPHWSDYLGEDHVLREAYEKLTFSKKSRIHGLTTIFFSICIVIWVSLGAYLMWLGLGSFCAMK